MNEREQRTAEALGLTDFKLVYRSGHGNVFCDGSMHAHTNGGYTRLEPMNHIRRLGKCDCAKWAAHNAQMKETA
jgi:hypothetical protein